MRVEILVPVEFDVEDGTLEVTRLRISSYAARTAVYNREFEAFHDGTTGAVELSESNAIKLGLAFNYFVASHREVFS